MAVSTCRGEKHAMDSPVLTVWSFELGKASIGEAVRDLTTNAFFEKAALIIRRSSRPPHTLASAGECIAYARRTGCVRDGSMKSGAPLVDDRCADGKSGRIRERNCGS